MPICYNAPLTHTNYLLCDQEPPHCCRDQEDRHIFHNVDFAALHNISLF